MSVRTQQAVPSGRHAPQEYTPQTDLGGSGGAGNQARVQALTGSAAGEPRGGSRHLVQRGDTLVRIAEVTYGNGERLCFQLAHTHASPDWPHGQQQLHLDFVVDPDAVSAAHRHALAVGARLLHPHDEPDIGAAESGFIAYADPSGHPFCLCWRQ